MTDPAEPWTSPTDAALLRTLRELDEVEYRVRYDPRDPLLEPPPLTAAEFEALLPIEAVKSWADGDLVLQLRAERYIKLARWSQRQLLEMDQIMIGTFEGLGRQLGWCAALREMVHVKIEQRRARRAGR